MVGLAAVTADPDGGCDLDSRGVDGSSLCGVVVQCLRLRGGDLAFAAGSVDPVAGGVQGYLVVVGDAGGGAGLVVHIGQVVWGAAVGTSAWCCGLGRR